MLISVIPLVEDCPEAAMAILPLRAKHGWAKHGWVASRSAPFAVLGVKKLRCNVGSGPSTQVERGTANPKGKDSRRRAEQGEGT